jgi:hypothetical protein
MTTVVHDHGGRPAECSFRLVDLTCGCQDAHYACGVIDREHDHVDCPGAADRARSADLAENDARAALSQALSGLQADMLNRGEDITVDTVWRSSKRAFLEQLIRQAQLELAKPPRSPEGRPMA